MVKKVFENTGFCYLASKDEYSSESWWNSNTISVLERIFYEKSRLKKALDEFHDSKICKEDKTSTLYSVAMSKYIADCESLNKVALNIAKEYASAIEEISNNRIQRKA